MPNLNLTIAEIMQGDTPVLKIMKGTRQVWPYFPWTDEVEGQFYSRTTAGGLTLAQNKAMLWKVKGKTLVFRQMVVNGNFDEATGWRRQSSSVTPYTISNGVLTMNVSSVGYQGGVFTDVGTIIDGHKYWMSGICCSAANDKYGRGAALFMCRSATPNVNNQQDASLINFGTTTLTRKSIVFEGSSSYHYLVLKPRVVSTDTSFSNVMLVDLTLMFGEGNEPTAAQMEELFPLDYYDDTTEPYMLNFVGTGLVSKDSLDTPLGTLPLNITTLTGKLGGSGESTVIFSSGMRSVGSVYDEIHKDNRQWVAVVRIGSRAYSSEDDGDSSVVTDGVTTNYVLDNPLTYIIDSLQDTFTVGTGGTESITPANGSTLVTAPPTMAIKYIT